MQGDLRQRIQAEQFDAALEQGIQAWLGEFEHLCRLDLAQVPATHTGRDAARELAFKRDQGYGGHGWVRSATMPVIISLLV